MVSSCGQYKSYLIQNEHYRFLNIYLLANPHGELRTPTAFYILDHSEMYRVLFLWSCYNDSYTRKHNNWKASHNLFALKKWRMHFHVSFYDVMQCHALARNWSIYRSSFLPIKQFEEFVECFNGIYALIY